MVGRRRWQFVLAVAVAVGPLVVGCGDDDAAVAVPSAEQLAAALLAPGDVEGTWTVNAGPEGSDAGDAPVTPAGVVLEEGQQLLPGIELCDAASDASRAAAAVRWQAFRQLDQEELDPIEPPTDRSGRMVFIQEFLTSAEPEEIETTFNLLREGMAACLGPIPAGEEGPGRSDAIDITAVGEDHYAVLTTIEEAGGGAQWHLYTALVRTGPTLVSVTLVEITAGEGVDSQQSAASFGDVVAVAVGRL